MKPEVFISYSWSEDEQGPRRGDIVDQIYDELKEKGYDVKIDNVDIQRGGKISEFMNRIGRGKYVVMVVSDKYLRSRFCMYEVEKVMRDEDYWKRVYPVVLPDADIYNDNELQYYQHWDQKIQQYQIQLENTAPEYTNNVRRKLDDMRDVRRIIDQFISDLTDHITINPNVHKPGDFSELISCIEKRRDVEKSDPQAVQNTFNALQRLNYGKQREFFEDQITYGDTKFGAFLIHGEHGFGQEWLYNSLIVSNDINTSSPLKLSVSNSFYGSDFEGLLTYFYVQEKQCDAPHEIDELIQDLQTHILERLTLESVVICFNESMLIEKSELKKFFQQFWKPLVQRASNAELINKLLLFFISENLHQNIDPEYEVQSSQFDQLEVERFTKLIIYDPIEPISKSELRQWVTNNKGSLANCFRTEYHPDKLDLWLEGSGGNPFKLIHRICHENKTPFDKHQKTWMKH